MSCCVRYTKNALKDIDKIRENKLSSKLKGLVEILKNNPYQNPPPYEKLVGDLNGFYSRRINIQHRLVYSVEEAEKRVKILSVWSHYEN